jgi:hypothetical protein
VIAPIVNREFLLAQAAQTRAGLERSLGARRRRGGRPGVLDDFSPDELRELITALDEALAAEPLERLEAALDQPDRGDASRVVPPKEDFVFIPRDPVLSVIQTVIEDGIEERAPEAVVEAPLADHRRGEAAPVVTDRQLAEVPLRRTPDGRRVWGKFEVGSPKILSDPGWILSGFAMGWRAIKRRAQFNATAAGPIPIANDARLLLVGDWGSGLPRATNVAEQMRKVLDAGAAGRREQHVVHLGDVYYSGSAREYRKRFLAPWPVKPGEDIGSFTLNGNHDMYLGGHAYYGTCLADARFARQEGSSFFALRNDHWQLLALDSAYEDGGLHGDQASWAKDRISQAPGLRTCLLSHHQLFSAHEPGAEVLREKIAPVLATGRIDAWFWGHEHRCIAYAEHESIGFASCVGHGGIPEYLVLKESEPLPQPAVYEYRKQYGEGWEPWDTFGFVVLDLDGDRMEATYIDEHGNRHHHIPNIARVPA